MTARERTVDQDGVVPVSVVVQLVSPTVNDTWAVLVGATASMSGATSEDANASASPAVSVEDEPNPPRTPLLLVLLPGEITSTLVPSSLICSRTSARAPFPSPTVRITAVMPMRMPSIVSADGAGVCERPRPRCGTCPSTSSRHLRSGGVDAAVTEADRPAHLRGDVGLVGDEDDGAARGVEVVQEGEDVRGRGRVEVAGGLVGQEERGLGHECPGDGDALLLAARELARLVLGTIGQAHLLERHVGAALALGHRYAP